MGIVFPWKFDKVIQNIQKLMWREIRNCAILFMGQLKLSIQEAIDFLVYSRKVSK